MRDGLRRVHAVLLASLAGLALKVSVSYLRAGRLSSRRFRRLLSEGHPPYASPMKISDMTPDELKELIKGVVDDRLRELLGDPDLGMELGEAVRARLKASLASTARITGDEAAEKLGLRW